MKVHQLLAWRFQSIGKFDSAVIHYLMSNSYIEKIPVNDFLYTSDYKNEFENNYRIALLSSIIFWRLT